MTATLTADPMTAAAAASAATNLSQGTALSFIDNDDARIPKVSLHEHLLWSLSPYAVLRAAAKNKREIPMDRIQGDFFKFKNMADMFLAHDQIRPAITASPNDYKDALADWLKFQSDKGVMYCEFMFSTQPHGDPDFFAKQLDAMADAIEAAEALWGIKARGILNGIRHHGLDKNHFMLDEFEKHRNRPSARFITGYGLSGNECADFPPEIFHDLFARAVDLGLQCTIHSGEVLGPDSIRKAMALPGVKRLGHGIRSIEDPELMAEIKQRGITLEICPTSNLSLLRQYRNSAASPKHKFHDLSCHPLATLRHSGIQLALGADDGPWFRTSISREYRRVAISFGLSLLETLQFTQNGIAAAFVTETERMELFNTYDQRLKEYQADCNELLKKTGASIGGAQIARTLLVERQR